LVSSSQAAGRLIERIVQWIRLVVLRMIAAIVARDAPLVVDVVVDAIGDVVVIGALTSASEEVVQMKQPLSRVVGIGKSAAN